LSPAALRAAASAVAPGKAADVTLLYEETDYNISASKTMTYTRHLIYRVETHAGVEDWSEASMDWDPWYQSASQIHARVLRGSGGFTELDQKTITDAPVNTDDMATYSLSRVRKAPLPAVAVGSIVEEVLSVEEKRPYFPGGSAYRYFFTNSAPTHIEKLVVALPMVLPFQERISNLPQAIVNRTEQGDRRRVIYEQIDQPATVSGDIDLASRHPLLPRVEFSTGTSWAAIAHEYSEMSEPHVALDQVQALLPASPPESRMKTIQMLVQRLHKEVRYTGVEFDEAQLVPQSAADVLKRHYGDCKDKATLLVTMLRAEKIPAYLALLSSGTGLDVHPDLPGMSRFNHAIVYVPPAGTEPALWIDATAEFNEVGSLPYEDAGRLALIIAPETTGLTLSPVAKQEDSSLIETRTYKLSELGASQVVESSETHGAIDADYRNRYGSTATSKKVMEDLNAYAKSMYLAPAVDKMEHGDGSDLLNPFHLTLTIKDARRGYTSLVDAAVYIYPTGGFYELPKWIRTAAVPLAENATAEQKEERAREESVRYPTYNIRPFTLEQRYRIVVPTGFALRALPADRTTPLGPGSLTEHYAQDGAGVVTATYRLATGKSELTAKEALELRDAVAAAYKLEAVSINFEQTGVKLLAQGKIKEALAADQSAIAQDPRAALPHVRLARALLEVGVGDKAKKEASIAVEHDPKSPTVLSTQGWVLQHDQLGNRFGPGFDRAGAIAALKKAVENRTEDVDSRFDLAVLYEFDATGVRYSANANLAEAISVYRSLIADDVKNGSQELAQHRVNLGYALLFHGDYKQVEALLLDIPTGINRSTLAITVAVAQKDVAAGLAAADRLNVSADERNKGLVSAGSYLAQLGLYAQASSILGSGIQGGGQDAAATARQVEMYRNLHRLPFGSPPVKKPEDVVFSFTNLMMSGTADHASLLPLFSHHAFASEAAFERNLTKNLKSAGFLHAIARQAQISEIVLRDLILGSMTLKATGDDASGYRVLAQSLGGQVSNYFVVKEDGSYRLVADDNDTAEVGNLALYALNQNQPALAKGALDWKRDLLHKGGGDDPFSGDLLPRYWTVGSTRPGADSPEAMRVAAVSLMANSMDVKPYLDAVVTERDKATGARQTDLNLLLASAYTGSEQPVPALHYIQELMKDEPDSATLLKLAMMDYEMSVDLKAWEGMLTERLARRPNDPDLLRGRARLLAAGQHFADARAADKALFDTGHATSGDYNSFAWLGLFDNHLGPEITEAAQQSNMLSKNGSFGDLHTLACIYAAQGKAAEARQVLTQAMTAGNLSQPNSEILYTLGLLYEDFGLTDAALEAYRGVEAHGDEHTFIDPSSTYVLAQKRVAALK
jgi:tetratricopeptide (TPR) repeat protein